MNLVFISLVFLQLSIIIETSPIENCTKLPPHKPTSIHDLHPNDVNVIMALGDSITAGTSCLPSNFSLINIQKKVLACLEGKGC